MTAVTTRSTCVASRAVTSQPGYDKAKGGFVTPLEWGYFQLRRGLWAGRPCSVWQFPAEHNYFCYVRSAAHIQRSRRGSVNDRTSDFAQASWSTIYTSPEFASTTSTHDSGPASHIRTLLTIACLCFIQDHWAHSGRHFDGWYPPLETNRTRLQHCQPWNNRRVAWYASLAIAPLTRAAYAHGVQRYRKFCQGCRWTPFPGIGRNALQLRSIPSPISEAMHSG